MARLSKEYAAAWRAAHREEIRAYMRVYREAHRLSMRRYQTVYEARHRERVRCQQVEAKRRYRAERRHAEKERARLAVRNAVRGGHLQKPRNCERCGAERTGRRLHGHHHDYAKPLEVVWLCVRCHRSEHRSGGPSNLS